MKGNEHVASAVAVAGVGLAVYETLILPGRRDRAVAGGRRPAAGARGGGHRAAGEVRHGAAAVIRTAAARVPRGADRAERARFRRIAIRRLACDVRQ